MKIILNKQETALWLKGKSLAALFAQMYVETPGMIEITPTSPVTLTEHLADFAQEIDEEAV